MSISAPSKGACDVGVEHFDTAQSVALTRHFVLTATTSSGPPSCYSHDHIVFLSINRFERKKNIALAVQALAVLRKTLPEDTFKRVHLVVAGGYDPRVKENVEYFEHLTELANAQGLLGEEESVSFVKSFTDAEKVRMLQMCAAVLYTPDREHFGTWHTHATRNCALRWLARGDNVTSRRAHLQVSCRWSAWLRHGRSSPLRVADHWRRWCTRRRVSCVSRRRRASRRRWSAW